MAASIRALILEQNAGWAEKIMEGLGSKFTFAAFDNAPNLTEALQLHIDNWYSMCLLPETLNAETVATFMADYAKLERQPGCVFVQVRASVDSTFDRTSLRDKGFTTVISRDINKSDIAVLEQVLHTRSVAEQIQEKIVDVEGAIKLVLSEIDRAAKEKKRGRQPKLNKLSANFVSWNANFDEQVLKTYFNSLTEKTAQHKATKQTVLHIPKDVKEKAPPLMTEEGYVGVSERVFKKLERLYGEDVPSQKEKEEK